jgi:DNA-binding NtrC family response regulator
MALNKPIRLLLVDDDPSQLELSSLALKMNNDSFVIESTETVEKALKLINSQRFDCIVCNYVMPRMNGVELYKMIRGGGITTPFILHTGQDSESVIREAHTVGVDDYHEKCSELTNYKTLAQKIITLVSK